MTDEPGTPRRGNAAEGQRGVVDDARERAYKALAVANSNPPLRPASVAYIELVSSPDPRIAPFVFALEHTRVRVGRFSTEGTYATSSDLVLAVAETATAIAPMNAMFEFIDGEFHVFDTRSPHGTAVNGQQIKKRRLLAVGDVIEVGGVADDAGVRVGAAKLVFLGSVAPEGRAVMRAPVQTHHVWHSPRGSVEVHVDSATGTARATLDMATDWIDPTMQIIERIGAVSSPFLPATTTGDVVRFEVGEPLTEIPLGWKVDLATASAIVADVCDAAAASPTTIGPFFRQLVWRRPNGRAVVFAAGLSREALTYDRGMRGRYVTLRHWVLAPEDVMGADPTAATDAYFAAYFLVELVTTSEPFPTDEETAYMSAVRAGAAVLPDELEYLRSAFDPDPGNRPTLQELAAMLRGEPAPPRKSWWQRLFR